MTIRPNNSINKFVAQLDKLHTGEQMAILENLVSDDELASLEAFHNLVVDERVRRTQKRLTDEGVIK